MYWSFYYGMTYYECFFSPILTSYPSRPPNWKAQCQKGASAKPPKSFGYLFLAVCFLLLFWKWFPTGGARPKTRKVTEKKGYTLADDVHEFGSVLSRPDDDYAPTAAGGKSIIVGSDVLYTILPPSMQLAILFCTTLAAVV